MPGDREPVMVRCDGSLQPPASMQATGTSTDSVVGNGVCARCGLVQVVVRSLIVEHFVQDGGPVGGRGQRRPMNRILWNRRRSAHSGGDIDEVVLHDVKTVHVEQMHGRCWWIGIYLDDGREWMGNFIADSRGRMRFMEQENDGVEWDDDRSHEEGDSDG